MFTALSDTVADEAVPPEEGVVTPLNGQSAAELAAAVVLAPAAVVVEPLDAFDEEDEHPVSAPANSRPEARVMVAVRRSAVMVMGLLRPRDARTILRS
ncbi:MAG: hypothetical protein EBX39_14310 [Actinobacteria bacterium]|nr:hypothetical protein [Actinomycetota bacterium]